MLQLDVSKAAFYQVESMEEEGGADSKGQDEGYFDDEDSNSDEQDKTNSRDVGHNIYILAHQVSLVLLTDVRLTHQVSLVLLTDVRLTEVFK